MAEYLVTWQIDIEAASPLEAARKALAIHRKPDSIATIFEVRCKTGKAAGWRYDLTENTREKLEG
jgi:hypothetical protein